MQSTEPTLWQRRRSVFCWYLSQFPTVGGGPSVVVSTAAFHARVRGSVPGLGGLKEIKLFLPHPRVKVSIVGSLRDREVACSASDRQGSNFESCVWRTVSSQSSHHPQEVLLAQFSLYVHKGGLKPDSFHFLFPNRFTCNLAHTIRSHCGDCPENLVRFDWVFQKLLMWCTETTLFPHRQSAENAGRHWNSTEEVPSPHRTCVTEQLELTRQVARIERVINNTTST